MSAELDCARDVLWHSVRPLLCSFVDQIAASQSVLRHYVGCASNEAFLLTAYASLRKHEASEEVAVLVDAKLENGEVVLCVDACMEFGEVLAVGPATRLSVKAIVSRGNVVISEWIERLSGFLASIEPYVRTRIALL